MAGIAMMLGIEGKNPSRSWQRYETGATCPPITVVAKMEMISEGQVTSASWVAIRQAYLLRRQQVSA